MILCKCLPSCSIVLMKLQQRYTCVIKIQISSTLVVHLSNVCRIMNAVLPTSVLWNQPKIMSTILDECLCIEGAETVRPLRRLEPLCWDEQNSVFGRITTEVISGAPTITGYTKYSPPAQAVLLGGKLHNRSGTTKHGNQRWQRKL